MTVKTTNNLLSICSYCGDSLIKKLPDSYICNNCGDVKKMECSKCKEDYFTPTKLWFTDVCLNCLIED